MFSREYFKYLFNSKKYLLLFIFLISLLMVIAGANLEFAFLLQFVFSLLLSFVMPVLVFDHVHDKKAVDTYFSLPLSRKKMLYTGLVFCFAIVYPVLMMAVIAYGIKLKLGLMIIALAFELAIGTLAIILFNTTLYLIGNNLVDGIVMMGAYTFLPLAVYGVFESFVYSFVAGHSLVDESFIRLFSPVYMAADMLIKGFDVKQISLSSLIGSLLFIVVFNYLVKRSYIDRALERTGSRSDKLYSYPLVINLYLVIMLFIIATFFSMNYKDLASFFKDYLILYVLLFAVFIAAYFVYERKLYFSYKLPLFYVAVMVVSLLFATVCRDTKGFDLAYRYEKAGGKDYCVINTWDGGNNMEIRNYIHEKSNDPKFDYINIFVEVGSPTHDMDAEMLESTADIIDKYRIDGIENFYDYRNYDNGNLMIMAENSYRSYSYRLQFTPTLDELLQLAKDAAVKITITTDEYEYELQKDGSLRKITY